MADDAERERRRQQWNEALERGNPDEIAALQDEILYNIAVDMMNDDPNYVHAGWKRTE